MGVFNLFSSTKIDIDTFEKELNELSLSITKTNREIIKLNELKKKLIRSISYYLSIIYVLVLSVLIIKLPHRPSNVNNIKWFFINQSKQTLLLVFGIPVTGILLSFGLKKVIQMLVNARDKRVRKLRTKQKTKIDELKKLTNYNTTNDLLTKYDNEKKKPSKSESNKQAQTQKPAPKMPEVLKATEGSKSPIVPGSGSTNPGSVPGVANPPPTQYLAPAPVKRTIQDRVLDLLIGSEDDSVDTRYALICKNCFNHCGLAPPGTKDPYTVNYVCPHCKTFNGKELTPISSPNSDLPSIQSPTQSPEIKQGVFPVQEPQVEEQVIESPSPDIKEAPLPDIDLTSKSTQEFSSS